VTEKIDTDLILQVVRGERHWSDLATIGIEVVFEGDAIMRVKSPRGIEAVARSSDIASGLLAYRSNSVASQDWARVVLAGIPFLELDLDEQPIGDILLDALSDARFGQEVSDQAYSVARQYARRITTED
jgi:hypothetical protein